MVQLGGFPSRLVGPLLKLRLPLIGNVFKQLAKSILVPLRLTAVNSAIFACTQKKTFGSGRATLPLAFSNEDLNDIMKTVKSLEESGLLIKGVSETIENEV